MGFTAKCLAAVLSTATTVLPGAAEFTRISGYRPESDVGGALKLGGAIEAISAALGEDPRNWSAATTTYQQAVEGASSSLRSVLPSKEGHRAMLATFTTYYGSEDYMHEFVSLALNGEGDFALDGKLREELTMKGIVLQGVLMASISNLHDALNACSTGSSTSSTPGLVDMAWALYAASPTHGPIKLAEKRAPQFDVEADMPSEAGSSVVNTKLLKLFEDLQASAKQANCVQMANLIPKIISLMQVPIIQGLLREAFEVDPKKIEETRGADGFVEVAEGWAFARAVLPSVAACSKDAADTIVRNMNTLGLGPSGPHMKDGFEVVKSAVESVYPCMGISCSDVNAMVAPWKTDQLLWEPCTDTALGQDANPKGASSETSSAVRLHGVLTGVIFSGFSAWLLL